MPLSMCRWPSPSQAVIAAAIRAAETRVQACRAGGGVTLGMFWGPASFVGRLAHKARPLEHRTPFLVEFSRPRPAF